MGFLTEKVESALGIKRNIIPMGQPEQQKEYDEKTTVRKIVTDMGMSPERVDVIGDGEDLSLDEPIGKKTDITILPKQKGGNEAQMDFGEEIAACFIGFLLDPKGEDKEMWTLLNDKYKVE